MRPTGTLINATESFVVGAKTVLKQYSKRFIHSGLFGRTYDVLFTVIAQWRRLLIMYWENSERWIQSEIRGTKTKSRVDLGLESSSEGVLRFQSYFMISQWCHLPLRKSGQRWSNTWVAREGTARQDRQTDINIHTHIDKYRHDHLEILDSLMNLSSTLTQKKLRQESNRKKLPEEIETRSTNIGIPWIKRTHAMR